MHMHMHRQLPTQAAIAKRIGCALLLGLVLVGNAQATNSNSNSNTQTQAGTAVSARAVLDFRIVIRDSVRMGGPMPVQRPTVAQMTRIVSIENGRQVITHAKP